MHYKRIDLFGNEETILITKKIDRINNSLLSYDGFIEKFETKKTTDDCYTPPDVYNIILKFVSDNYDMTGCNIVRPFYPNGDYESIDYLNNDIVIDNPPFSIISKIAKFYIKHKIKFFLFAPHMTLFSSDMDCTYVVCGANIIYENGAVVKTSFLSNIFPDTKVIGDSKLFNDLSILNKKKNELPKYEYPQNVLTVSMVSFMVEKGIDFCLKKGHLKHVRSLDDQKKSGKTIFGSGFLISKKAALEKAAAEKAAAEKAAAEKAAAEKKNVMIWQLSDREIKEIESLF